MAGERMIRQSIESRWHRMRQRYALNDQFHRIHELVSSSLVALALFECRLRDSDSDPGFQHERPRQLGEIQFATQEYATQMEVLLVNTVGEGGWAML